MFNPPTTSRSSRGFSLIEILVVIAIMAVLAGMIVGLAGVVGDRKAISKTEAEVQRLSLLIETYRSKIGVLPPDNTNNPSAPTNTSLFYELAGAINNGNGTFTTPFGDVSVATLTTACSVGGIINAAGVTDIEDRAQIKRLIRDVKSWQTNTITVNGQDIIVFTAPADGPNDRKVNPFFYRIGSPNNGTHNANGFDVWAEIKTRSGSKIIGNWKE
jgi:prepilin-type N-terminal cleavage/methylation domain-containing protein